MSAPSSPEAPVDFLAMACRLSLIDDDAARRLREESLQSGTSPAQLVLRSGLLEAIDVAIVETLLDRHEAVPGFEIIDLIGRGGMGIVFRARQKSLDRVVALKTILFSQLHDPTALSRFEQEARAVAKLRHPNIVGAYDLGRSQRCLYLAMELVEGTDVEQFVRENGPLDERTAWGLVRQAASGLSHAASAGIIHRDVKPANLLLVDPPAGFEIAGGSKMVKITDFGLAFLMRDVEAKTRLTAANATIGSPHYIAPEQLEGDAFDHRVDIYSLGATVYHMLAGEPPFAGSKLSLIIAGKLTSDSLDVRAKAPHISSQSAELLKRMTFRDPDGRIAGYSELVAQIDALELPPSKAVSPLNPRHVLGPTQLIHSDPTPAQMDLTRATPRPKVERTHGRRKFLFVGGTALGAAAIGGVGWRLWPARRQGPSRALVPTGLSLPLFDGMSLAGWRAQSGAWTVKRNAEGGRVLAGTDGLIRHVLVKTDGNRKVALDHYRLIVVAQLHAATAAEIEFGGDSVVEDGERYSARFAKDGASLGRRTTSDGKYERNSEVKPLARSAEEAHALVIERQDGWWWYLVDEEPIGSVPIRDRHEEPAFRLRAEGGEVWFSDITVQELGSA